MKLFAIAATTAGVNAASVFDKYQPYRYQRVGPTDFPGPGHINEQGGYWADQPTVQSNSYVQPGQPGLPQPGHGPQHQCCSEIKFTAPNNDIVWFKQTGFRDGKPMYEGEHNGMSQVLFWQFDEVQSNMDVRAIPGKWNIGTSFTDVVLSSRETLGLTYCPDAQENGSRQSNDWDIRCEKKPIDPVEPEVLTCEEANSGSNRWGVWAMKDNQKSCHLHQLMEVIVRKQFNQFKTFLIGSKHNDAETFYSDGINAYRAMFFNPECDANTFSFENAQYINKCDRVCDHVGDVNVDSDKFLFDKTLSGFLSAAVTTFPSSVQEDAMNADPESRTFCGNEMAKLYRAMESFQGLLQGFEITSLPAAGNWQIKKANEPRSLGPE